MKVVKEGPGPWFAGKQARCGVCGTVVEFSESDGEKIHNTFLRWMRWVCPRCKSHQHGPVFSPEYLENFSLLRPES